MIMKKVAVYRYFRERLAENSMAFRAETDVFYFLRTRARV